MRALTITALLTSIVALDARAQNEIGPGEGPTRLPLDEPRAAAVVPGRMGFQGFLTDTGGSPLDGMVNLDLALYSTDSGGTEFWAETQTDVIVSQGIFSIQLGAVSPLVPGDFDGSAIYLGIRVDGGAEMVPRTELLTSPYAFHSLDADQLGGMGPAGYVETAGDDMSGPLGLHGGVQALTHGGVSERVSSTTDIIVRKYYFDGQADGWSREARIVLSFNGVGDTPTGGAGTATVYLNGAVHTIIDVSASGGRAWTYVVDLGTLANNWSADVYVRSDDPASPMFIRDISLDLGGSVLAPSGNTLDEAYDEGGFGEGRTINATSGAVEITGSGGLEAHDHVYAGAASAQTGHVHVYGSFAADPLVELTTRNSGGAVYIRDNNEVRMHYYETDGSTGGGAWWGVYGNTSFSGYVNIDGNVAGTGNPLMTIAGSGSTTRFDTREAGDDAVELPAASVSAAEISDEPGLSQGRSSGNVAITETATMQDVVTTTITIPAPGYIHVTASAQFRMTGVGTSDYVGFQIDETEGGSQDTNYYQYAGWSSDAGGDGTHYRPGHAQRTYYKSTAGTYTFRLEARDASGASTKYAWNPVVTALYVPTSYGTVQVRVSEPELAGFGDVEHGSTGTNGPGTADRVSAVVDLRELELRVARAEAEARSARMALLEAQLADGGNGPQRSVTSR